MTKIHSLTFYIESSSKFVGVGLHLALLKDKIISLAALIFFLFFLKCQIIVHEIKQINTFFNDRFFNI